MQILGPILAQMVYGFSSWIRLLKVGRGKWKYTIREGSTLD